MINCYEYCCNRVKFGESLDDPMVIMANDIEEKEEEIKILRRERFNFVSLGVNRANTPTIQIIDSAGFKQSVESEEKLLSDIAKNKSLFAKLNILFAEAQGQLVRFNKPTLKELAEYRQSCLNRAFQLDIELKDELHYRLTSSRNTSRSMDEVLAAPDFLEYKARTETTIAGLKEEAAKAEDFISRIQGIMAE